jgi:hypothetical protein
MGFGFFDLADGEGVPLPLVHELAIPAFTFELQGGHVAFLGQRKTIATETRAEELQKNKPLDQ